MKGNCVNTRMKHSYFGTLTFHMHLKHWLSTCTWSIGFSYDCILDHWLFMCLLDHWLSHVFWTIGFPPAFWTIGYSHIHLNIVGFSSVFWTIKRSLHLTIMFVESPGKQVQNTTHEIWIPGQLTSMRCSSKYLMKSAALRNQRGEWVCVCMNGRISWELWGRHCEELSESSNFGHIFSSLIRGNDLNLGNQ